MERTSGDVSKANTPEVGEGMLANGLSELPGTPIDMSEDAAPATIDAGPELASALAPVLPVAAATAAAALEGSVGVVPVCHTAADLDLVRAARLVFSMITDMSDTFSSSIRTKGQVSCRLRRRAPAAAAADTAAAMAAASSPVVEPIELAKDSRWSRVGIMLPCSLMMALFHLIEPGGENIVPDEVTLESSGSHVESMVLSV